LSVFVLAKFVFQISNSHHKSPNTNVVGDLEFRKWWSYCRGFRTFCWRFQSNEMLGNV